jgi:hypothetical protein
MNYTRNSFQGGNVVRWDNELWIVTNRDDDGLTLIPVDGNNVWAHPSKTWPENKKKRVDSVEYVAENVRKWIERSLTKKFDFDCEESRVHEITLVCGDDWKGLYYNGELECEGHDVQVEELMDAASMGKFNFDRVWADDDWLQREGNLPRYLKDVKFQKEEN